MKVCAITYSSKQYLTRDMIILIDKNIMSKNSYLELNKMNSRSYDRLILDMKKSKKSILEKKKNNTIAIGSF